MAVCIHTALHILGLLPAVGTGQYNSGFRVYKVHLITIFRTRLGRSWFSPWCFPARSLFFGSPISHFLPIIGFFLLIGAPRRAVQSSLWQREFFPSGRGGGQSLRAANRFPSIHHRFMLVGGGFAAIDGHIHNFDQLHFVGN